MGVQTRRDELPDLVDPHRAGEDHTRERLVHLDEVHVLEREARAIERLRRQGHITQREIIMLGTNHASKMITRLRRMGFISRKHGEAKNASGVGIHFVYLWTGK